MYYACCISSWVKIEPGTNPTLGLVNDTDAGQCQQQMDDRPDGQLMTLPANGVGLATADFDDEAIQFDRSEAESPEAALPFDAISNAEGDDVILPTAINTSHGMTRGHAAANGSLIVDVSVPFSSDTDIAECKYELAATICCHARSAHVSRHRRLATSLGR